MSAGVITWQYSAPEGQRQLCSDHAEDLFIDRERREVTVHRAGQPEYRVSVVSTGRLESNVVRGFWIEVEWL